jgi:hypothetical protein
MPCSVWSDDINNTIRQIRNYSDSATRPLLIFVGATCWKMTPSKLDAIVNTLKEDANFEFVRPDELARLAMNYAVSAA